MLSQTDILSRFTAVHGERYDYANVKTKGVIQKVTIGCRIHGDFAQTPHDHFHGRGCPSCSYDRNRASLESVVSKASLIHAGKYSYTDAFIEKDVLRNITCLVHGKFDSLKSNHLARHGCPKCSASKSGKRRTSSIESRIEQARMIHGNRYDYSLAEGGRGKTKVSIGCNVHGAFKQHWHNHIMGGQGCPSCKVIGRYSEEFFKTYLDRKTFSANLYVIRMAEDDGHIFYKIGITINFKNRLKAIPYTHSVVSLRSGNLYDLFLVEQKFLHEHGYKNRYTPKIHFGGDRECFILPEKQVLQVLRP